MKTRTEKRTEYAPCRRTPSGTWRPVTLARFRSRKEVERFLKKAGNPYASLPAEDFKIMQRTVIVTLSEWKDCSEVKVYTTDKGIPVMALEGIVDPETQATEQGPMKKAMEDRFGKIVDRTTWEAAQKKMKEEQPAAPRGYKCQDGKLVIDEEDAEKIREIFDRYTKK